MKFRCLRCLLICFLGVTVSAGFFSFSVEAKDCPAWARRIAASIGTNNPTIIGGGPVGSLVALGLALRGLDVTVVEMRPDIRTNPYDFSRSFNLTLAHRGIAALRQVGVADSVLRLTTPVTHRVVHGRNDRLIEQAYGPRSGQDLYSIRRGDMTMALMDAAEATGKVHYAFGQRLVGWRGDPNLLSFQSCETSETTTVEAGFVLGTDGACSEIRRGLVGPDRIEQTESAYPIGYKQMSLSPDANGRHKIASYGMHLWPRGDYLMIAVPNSDGSFSLVLFMNAVGETSFQKLNTAEAVSAFFQKNFPDLLALQPDLLDGFVEKPLGSLRRVHLTEWTDNKGVVLLGDAAHAMPPFYGQGTNTGFQDVDILLRIFDREQQRWPSTFQAFNRFRPGDGVVMRDLSEEQGNVLGEKADTPAFQLRFALENKLAELFPERYMPSYELVVFSNYLLSDVGRRVRMQDVILNDLLMNVHSLEGVDWARAAQLVQDHLSPFSTLPTIQEFIAQ